MCFSTIVYYRESQRPGMNMYPSQQMGRANTGSADPQKELKIWNPVSII